MGTRNLTIVKLNKEIKVCQYGQWDGYPTGQGQTIADFLKKVKLAKFKKQIKALKKWTDKEIQQAYVKAGADPDSEWVNMEVSEKVKREHPELSRDYGAGVLQLIHDGIATKVSLYPEDYKEHSSCEYWYEIDLDKNTVLVNGRKPCTFEQWSKEGYMKKLDKLI